MDNLPVKASELVSGHHAFSGLREALSIIQRSETWTDVEDLLLRNSGLAAGSYRTYSSNCRQFFKRFENRPPWEILPAHLERYYEELVEKYPSATVTNKLAALRAFFKLASERLHIDNPFDALSDATRKKMSKAPKATKKQALSKAAYKRFMGWLEQYRDDPENLQMYAVAKFLVSTGLRAAEVSRTTYADLERNEDTGGWTVMGIGKGSKPYVQEVADPGAIEACQVYFRARFHRDPRDEDHLFHGKRGKAITPKTLWTLIHDVGGKAKVGGIVPASVEMSPHLFRRTAATLLDAAGMSPVGISQFLRHADISTTVKHYIDNTQSAAGYLAGVMA